MKLFAIAASLFAVASPSKTISLAIVHAVSGCHVWQTTRSLGPSGTLTLQPGGKIVLRVNCPMDFTITQLRGPKLALGDPTMHTGTTRTLVFVKRGTYVLRAVNLQTSADAGLQTLGTDNVLTLTVKVS
jgi:hypothetical protein